MSAETQRVTNSWMKSCNFVFVFVFVFVFFSRVFFGAFVFPCVFWCVCFPTCFRVFVFSCFVFPGSLSLFSIAETHQWTNIFEEACSGLFARSGFPHSFRMTGNVCPASTCQSRLLIFAPENMLFTASAALSRHLVARTTNLLY